MFADVCYATSNDYPMVSSILNEARALRVSGDVYKADALLTRAQRIAPRSADVYLEMAGGRKAQGDETGRREGGEGGAERAEGGAGRGGAGAKGAGGRRARAGPTAAGSQGYTVRIQSTDAGASGIALAEIYDPDAIGAPISLVNVSALGFSGTDENVLAPGFVIDGSGAKTMLIRVVGPSLTDFGVTGVMADPRLSLIPAGQSNVIAQNDNWGGTTELKEAFATTGAFQLSSDGSLDAAVLVRLPPGAYTVKPEGFAEGTGTILVEVYAVEE